MVLARRYRAALYKTFELKRQQETNDRRRLGMAAGGGRRTLKPAAGIRSDNKRTIDAVIRPNDCWEQ